VTLIPESYFRRWTSLVDVDEVDEDFCSTVCLETTLFPRNSDSIDPQFLGFAFWCPVPDR
jgi:hypothetical protein